MRLHIKNILLYLVTTLTLLTSCELDPPQLENTNRGNFEALWKIMDERYCFFAYKDSIVDWDEVYHRYSPLVTEQLDNRELFDLLGRMLAEVQDGHVNLYSAFDIARYWKWFEDYPQNYDARLIDEYYLGFDYGYVGGIKYKVLHHPNAMIGYMHYGSFSSTPSQANLSYILSAFSLCDGLIIDLRDNGGGSLANVGSIASRFTAERITSGYIQHKTAPARDAFSELYPTYLDPAKESVQFLDRPVVLLTNRSCYSATNDFVSVMRALPLVVQVGNTTGGGSGLPFSAQLPNGWGVRLSASPMYNHKREQTEFGIAPNYEVNMSGNPQYDEILEYGAAVIAYYKNFLEFPQVSPQE